MATTVKPSEHVLTELIYTRISVNLQAAVQSCQPLTELCRQHLKSLRIDPEPFVVITDEGDCDRPALKKILELSESRQLRCLISVSRDRFGRTDGTMTFIRNKIGRGGQVLTVDGSFSTGDLGWSNKSRAQTLPADAADVLHVERLELRIIDNSVSNGIQVLLKKSGPDAGPSMTTSA